MTNRLAKGVLLKRYFSAIPQKPIHSVQTDSLCPQIIFDCFDIHFKEKD
jgi:hypothetical protein